MPEQAKQKLSIVFALVDSGMGHRSPALAVKEHLKRVAPECFAVVLVDLMEELGLRRLDWIVKRGWTEVLLRYPRLIDLLYWVGHAFAGVLVPAMAFVLTPQFRRLERYCRGLRADLLVTTHFLTTNLLAILRQRGSLRTPVIGMVVDPFETYHIAAHPALDGLITFSRRSLTAYRTHLPGVDVTLLGFPLTARFIGRVPSRAEARRTLGISSGTFVLLMTAGAEGVGNFDRYFERVIEASMDLHVIVVCGRNALLRRKLQGRSCAACTILGFVDDMEELIAACDVFVGAGGANLTMEALSIGRPAILTLRTANIRGTVDYVVRRGFGWRCTRVDRFVPLLDRLLRNPRLVREAERRIASAGLGSGTPELAAYLTGLLDGHRPGLPLSRPRPRADRIPP